MSTVLITGARGFLGRNTAALFKDRGWRVVGIGHGHWGFEDHSNFGIDCWLETDIHFYGLEKIREELNCVVHCAGGASVGYSVQYPFSDFDRTVTTSMNLLEYLRLSHPQAKLIYPSSAAVYGKRGNHAIREDSLLRPVSPYGFHKRMAEDLLASYSLNFGLSTAIIRFFSIYGSGLEKQLLWDACNKLSAHSEEVVFFGTGDETRDWIHVKDAANLIYCMAESTEDNETVNGGSGDTMTIKQVTTELANLLDISPQITFNQEYREGDPKHYCADITKAKSRNWQPTVVIKEGLSEYVDWYKKQRKN